MAEAMRCVKAFSYPDPDYPRGRRVIGRDTVLPSDHPMVAAMPDSFESAYAPVERATKAPGERRQLSNRSAERRAAAQAAAEQRVHGNGGEATEQVTLACPEAGCDFRTDSERGLKIHTARSHGDDA